MAAPASLRSIFESSSVSKLKGSCHPESCWAVGDKTMSMTDRAVMSEAAGNKGLFVSDHVWSASSASVTVWPYDCAPPLRKNWLMVQWLVSRWCQQDTTQTECFIKGSALTLKLLPQVHNLLMGLIAPLLLRNCAELCRFFKLASVGTVLHSLAVMRWFSRAEEQRNHSNRLACSPSLRAIATGKYVGAYMAP